MPKRARRQVAALPFVRDAVGGLRLLLITSRRTKRWIIPKGWKPRRMKARKAAAREAREEAGIAGKTSKQPLGAFFYAKEQADSRTTCKVKVFALSVDGQLAEWKEQGERSLRWCSPDLAAELVSDPGLAELISAHFIAGGDGQGNSAGQA